ncbi:MAG TPA: VOC family protein [Thermomicrobiaceae bacterium]|nr:VOC family protein [Thermomicrobiaceae bacterium]
MDLKLELITLPSDDIDRAKAFYAEKAGFNVDVDYSAGDFRVVQLTPPGSACSIALMRRSGQLPHNVQGMHLVVSDIEAVRAELLARGLELSELFHFDEGGQQPGPDPERRDYNSFCSFSDPDGNGWLLQEVKRADAE